MTTAVASAFYSYAVGFAENVHHLDFRQTFVHLVGKRHVCIGANKTVSTALYPSKFVGTSDTNVDTTSDGYKINCQPLHVLTFVTTNLSPSSEDRRAENHHYWYLRYWETFCSSNAKKPGAFKVHYLQFNKKTVFKFWKRGGTRHLHASSLQQNISVPRGFFLIFSNHSKTSSQKILMYKVIRFPYCNIE